MHSAWNDRGVCARKGACAVRSAATAGIFHYYKVAELAGPSTILIHCMRCLAHGQLSSIQARWNIKEQYDRYIPQSDHTI